MKDNTLEGNLDYKKFLNHTMAYPNAIVDYLFYRTINVEGKSYSLDFFRINSAVDPGNHYVVKLQKHDSKQQKEIAITYNNPQSWAVTCVRCEISNPVKEAIINVLETVFKL